MKLMNDMFLKTKLNGVLTERDRAFLMGIRQVALNLVDLVERRLDFEDAKRTSCLRKAARGNFEHSQM